MDQAAKEVGFDVHFDQVPIGIAHLDLQRRIQRANRRFCEIFGYSHAELAGRSVAELSHPEDRDAADELRAQMHAAAADRFGLRKRYLRKDGETIWVDLTVTLVRDERGAPLYEIAVYEDVTERKRTEEKLRASESRLRSIVGNEPECIKLLDADGSLLEMNPAGLAMIEVDDFAAVAGQCVYPIVAPEYREAFRALIERVCGGERSTMIFEIVGLKGTRRWLETHAVPSHDALSGKTLALGITRDITERKHVEDALRESEARYRTVSESMLDGILILQQGRFVHANPAALRLLGRSAEALIGAEFAPLVHPDFRDLVVERHRRRIAGEVLEPRYDIQVLNAQGEAVWVQLSNEVIEWRGQPAVLTILSDLTERKRAEERLTHLAQFDALTELPNRSLLIDRLQQAIVYAQRHQQQVGVLFVDLDRFKLVNDTLGHHLGDRMIAQVAARIVACLRSGDTVGRISGDEFAVVLSELALPDDAALVARKILNSFDAPFDLEGHETYISASIGIAVYPQDGEDAVALLKDADAAMYLAKQTGRDRYCFYTTDLNERAIAKLQLTNDLRRAVERREFCLHYQPKVDLASGALAGLEALVRWQHPQRGLVPPLDFIPALEESGLIVQVGNWVIEEAVAQLARWRDAGLALVPIAVNLSPRQFRSNDLAASIRSRVAAAGIAPALIELEITESFLMDKPKKAIRTLKALNAAGLRISIDDFGTGYSSLSYLTRFPLTSLKIDRSFVRDLHTGEDATAIARAIIDMAHTLRLTVVAEGVETEEQAAFLRTHGCEQGQGYLFARPAPAAEVAARLRPAAAAASRARAGRKSTTPARSAASSRDRRSRGDRTRTSSRRR